MVWTQKYASARFGILALFLKHVHLPKGETEDMAQASQPWQGSGKHDSKAKGQNR